jgi:prepilin-type N-terminal cleavage/methylation domain-containing protein
MMHKRLQGFTLVELAIGLAIVALLLGGLLMPLSAQIKARRIQETRHILEQVRESLIGYALSHRDVTASANPYLPCPDINGDGIEDRSANVCVKTTGRLPWTTLGIGEADDWGNRLEYSVSQTFSNSNVGFVRSPVATTVDRSVCPAWNNCGAPIQPAVVIVSHGANGYGALNSSGNTNQAPSAPDEQENGNGDAVFVHRPPSDAGSTLGEFDDLVVWLMPDYLFARVCSPAEPDC